MKVKHLVILIVPLESEWSVESTSARETYSTAHGLAEKYKDHSSLHVLEYTNRLPVGVGTMMHLMKAPPKDACSGAATNAMTAASQFFAQIRVGGPRPLLTRVLDWTHDARGHLPNSHGEPDVDFGEEADVGVIVVAHTLRVQQFRFMLVLDNYIDNSNGHGRLPNDYAAPMLVEALRRAGLRRVRKLLFHACSGSLYIDRLERHLIAGLGAGAPQLVASWTHWTSGDPETGQKLMHVANGEPGDPSTAFLHLRRSLAEHGGEFAALLGQPFDAVADALVTDWIDWDRQGTPGSQRLNTARQKHESLAALLSTAPGRRIAYLIDDLVGPTVITRRVFQKQAWVRQGDGYVRAPLQDWHDDP